MLYRTLTVLLTAFLPALKLRAVKVTLLLPRLQNLIGNRTDLT